MATHGTTRATSHKNIFNMAVIVMDDISSNSGIFCDSKLYHLFFRYNISDTVYSNKDLVAVLPTGYGKSLIFYILPHLFYDK